MFRSHMLARAGLGAVSGLFLLFLVFSVKDRSDPLPPRPTSSSTGPAVLSADYVASLMARLDQAIGGAVRSRGGEEPPYPVSTGRLRDVYTGTALDQALADLARAAPLGADAGDPVTTVADVVRADTACIVALVDRDFSATFGSPDAMAAQRYVALVPRPADLSPGRTNPTGWALAYDAATVGGKPPLEYCPR